MRESALLKSPEDSPPSIGIVCSLTTYKENNITLGVNWIYRPYEVKRGKGILLVVAPKRGVLLFSSECDSFYFVIPSM